MRAYDSDKSFRKKMDKQAGARFWDKKEKRRDRVYALTCADEDLSTDDKWQSWMFNPLYASSKGDKDIKKSLYSTGYTSQYGTTNSSELFAEAFADYYSTKNKNEEYARKGSKKREKENPLSKAIMDISRELFDSDNNRKEFMKKHRSTYDRKPAPSGK